MREKFLSFSKPSISEKEIEANEPIVKRASPFIIAIACLIVLLIGSFDRDLWTPDEPRVAAIALEMSKTGQYLIPHLAGTPFVEKPPLYFAVAAVFIKTIGQYTSDINAIRLTTVLFGIGTLVMTFLMAIRLYSGNRNLCVLSVAVLVTMVGFVVNFHWIRVDAALCFFVIAAVWSIGQAYIAHKIWYCIPAGLFSAGAFLSKGPIGPVLIVIPWFTLFVQWFMSLKGNPAVNKVKIVGSHVAGLLVFLLLAGSWVLYLKTSGGTDLWNHWFWDNQVGRLSGTATELGHIRRGQPFYYLLQMAGDTSPWFPLIIVWLGVIVTDLFKRRSISQSDIFLLSWGMGTLLLLSLSATKRGIYMAPLLPAFAMMCIPALNIVIQNKCIRRYAYFWGGLCVCLLAFFTFVPFAASHLPQSIPVPALAFLRNFGVRNFAAGAACLASLYILFSFGRQQQVVVGMIFMTVFLNIGMFLVPVKAIDFAKSMRADTLKFTSPIPPEQRAYIAGYGFSETMLGCFYFYAGWTVPQVTDRAHANRILAQNDPQYTSIIIAKKNSHRTKVIESINQLAERPYQVLTAQPLGDKRMVFWIKGIDSFFP